MSEIAQWSAGAQEILADRKHVVSAAYACGGNEFMTTGTVTLKLKNGREASSRYCARCLVDDVISAEPRVKVWQGWFVSLTCL